MFTSLTLYFSPFLRHKEEFSLLQIFKPLYLVLCVFGLIPCSINFPKKKKNCTILLKPYFSRSLRALFILLVVYIFFGLHVHQVITSSEDNVLAEGAMAKANYVIELITAILFCTTTYFCVHRKKDVYASMFRHITRAWDDLNYVNRDMILSRLRVQVNCVVFGNLIMILIMLTTVTFVGQSSLWKRILITFSFNIPEMIQFIVVAFYFVLILTVVALLKNIESHCKMFKQVRRIIKGSEVELARSSVTLSQMQTVYVTAMRVKRQINEVFQAPILFTLLQCFHTAVSESCDLCLGLFYKDNFSVQHIIECSFWVMLQFIKVYVLARSGSLLKSEADNIGRIIHDIPNSEEEDIDLFMEMVAAAAMYLVILVQFAA
ncbi:uncharacterized protein LOC133523971 isoform X2 [Cydia pomonella]|uniref:uncharacterized protein LOC133523971 isoform X2 n=1 Tax=Cydia pomonella TaxID=82600 RepID=UPI002ADD3770|nr:uncharacterized protein LOC133523971 isoform X2 [Cydia pomonella]